MYDVKPFFFIIIIYYINVIARFTRILNLLDLQKSL